MASIRQRGKKKTYYALFRGEDGVLQERSTKTGDRKKAQQMADEWEKVARPNVNKVTAVNMRKVLAEVHKKMAGEDLPSMTVKDFFDQWRSVRKNEVSEDTYVAYNAVAELFLNYLGDRAKKELFLVQKTDIVLWRDAVRKRVSGSSTNHRLKILRMVFRQAKLDGWILDNPCEGVRFVKVESAQKNPKRPFTPDEIKSILKVCDEEWEAMVIRGYYTGQRLLDIAMMTAGMEDPLLGQVKFWSNKTDIRVITEMPPAYINYVLNKPSCDDPKKPLHPRAYASVMKRKKNRTTTISNWFNDVLALAGLRKKRSHRKMVDGPGRSGRRARESLSFHSLRHSMVSHMADAGVSRSIVQDIVGHESAEVNAAYTHMDRKTKQEAMAKLPDITK